MCDWTRDDDRKGPESVRNGQVGLDLSTATYRRPGGPCLLLRKEVIQLQVPLQLPCYDFIPITSLTIGRCLPCGLAHVLRVKPAFMM